MAYLDETIPPDNEAVTLGASRIRELKVNLDAIIEQIFEDAGTFVPGWIAAAGATGGTSMFAAGAIQSADIGAGQVGTLQLAATSVTTAKLALTSVGTAQLALTSVGTAQLIDTSVTAAKLALTSVGTAQLIDTSVTAAKLASGLIKGAAVGSFAGSNSVSASISSLAFNPNVLILATNTLDGFGISFLAEAVSSISDIHVSWSNVGIVSPNTAAIHWQAGGFIVVPTNAHFNQSGKTTYYLALVI